MARTLIWVGSSQKDLSAFPEEIQNNILTALELAQEGLKAAHAKPLKGFSGASVLEIVESDASGTYHGVYTVRFKTGIYVLHAFQKKSRKGIATPQEHIEMIKRRLKIAAQWDAETMAREKKERS
jgi:phage-related protein